MTQDEEEAAISELAAELGDAVIAKLSEDVVRLRAALQSIADYRSTRIGTEAWGLTASYCQATAREALAAHKGGITT